MNTTDAYQVAFTGLAPGTHTFDFRVGDTFFMELQDSEITGGNVAIEVVMEKQERMMDLHFTIAGTVTTACDRCNEPVNIRVNGSERLIVKLGDGYVEESENVQIIPESAHRLDLGPFLYQFIHLLLPLRKVHPENGKGSSRCNPEILKKLDELSPGHNPDPRWEVLRKLKEGEE